MPQKTYLTLTIAYQKALRESKDPARYAEIVSKQQFEEHNGTQRREQEPTRTDSN
jgi:hypothetical protein